MAVVVVVVGASLFVSVAVTVAAVAAVATVCGVVVVVVLMVGVVAVVVAVVVVVANVLRSITTVGRLGSTLPGCAWDWSVDGAVSNAVVLFLLDRGADGNNVIFHCTHALGAVPGWGQE